MILKFVDMLNMGIFKSSRRSVVAVVNSEFKRWVQLCGEGDDLNVRPVVGPEGISGCEVEKCVQKVD